MKTTRVVLIGDYPLNSRELVGGPQSVFFYLLEGMKQLEGLDIHIVTCCRRINDTVLRREENTSYYYLPYPRIPFGFAFPLIQRSVHAVLKEIRPDIVHSQTALYGALCTGAGFPLVTTIHNIPGSEAKFGTGKINRLRLALHDTWIGHVLFGKAQHIICISEYIRNGIVHKTNANLYSIDNPVSNAFFNLSASGSLPGRLLFVGQIRKRKRPDLALRAFEMAKRSCSFLTLRMAGGFFDRKLASDMEKFILEKNLSDSVRLMGHLDEEAILKQYQEASTVLLTSELETSPMSVQQAMSAKRGVVVTSVGGVPYLIEDERTGLLIKPGDVHGTASAIVRLESNETLKLRIVQEAHKRAVNRFDSFRVAERTRDVYLAILGS